MRCRQVLLAFVGLMAFTASSFGTGRPADVAQFWMGEILLPNAACPRMQFIVKLRSDADGAWSGFLSIPRGCGAHGALDVPLKEIEVTATRVAFTTIPPTENAYSATAPKDGGGAWTGQVLVNRQQGVEIRMWRVTEEEARQAAPRRPQLPTGEPPYDVREVAVPAPTGTDANSMLSGTLSVPQGTGPFVSVVLVGDAEADDRDHTEGTHKPFLVLADRLTRAGFAVLRCDDRGVGDSHGSMNDATLEDASRDVVAQVAFLRTLKEIDGSRIGLLGRGEGAHICAKAAGEGASDVAFLVMLAPGGQRGVGQACTREEWRLRSVGEDPTYISGHVDRLRQILELAATGDEHAQLDNALQEDVRTYVSSRRGMGLDLNRDQVSMWAASRREFFERARFRSWLAADPTEAYRKVACPVLVLGGELDLESPVEVELPLVRAALKGNPRVTVKVLPRTNHAMQPCVTGFADEADLIETTFSEPAIAEILEFLRKVGE